MIYKKAYVIAYPVGHSLSPIMHNAAFKHLGLNAHYEALEVPSEELPDTLKGLRSEGIYGANVTIPYKLAVIPFLDELTSEAQNIGAVNTIINRNGYLIGHNTDAIGFIRSLRESANFLPAKSTVMLLGAGGAARAILYALLIAKVKEISVYNRTLSNAERLVNDFKHLGKIQTVDKYTFIEATQRANLLVNTTSVGMEKSGIDPKQSPLPDNFLPLEGLVCDIIYRPRETALLKNARRAGLQTLNGLPMLVYQGAEAFSSWTSIAAPIKIMFAALEEQLG